MESAKAALVRENPTDAKTICSTLLFGAYAYRIERAIAGEPHAGMLPEPLRDDIDRLIAKKMESDTKSSVDPLSMAHYAISRMREQSKILEPQEKLSAHSEYLKHGDELKLALAELPKITDVIAMTLGITFASLYIPILTNVLHVPSRPALELWGMLAAL